MRGFLLGAAALVALPAGARAEQFRYKYRPGQVIIARAGMAGATMMGPPGGAMVKARFRVSMRQVQRVLSVSGGVVTLEVTDTPTSSTATALGRTQAGDRTPTRSLVKMTERGRFISRKPLGTKARTEETSGLDAADALYGLNFPDRDIQPGDTWEDSIELGDEMNPRKVQMTCRFVGRETFRGRSCVKINTHITMAVDMSAGDAPSGGATGEGKVVGNVTTHFDPAAGVEVYSSGSLILTARADLGSAGGGGEFASVSKFNLTQSLVSAGSGKKR